jgi:hypothetical protein
MSWVLRMNYLRCKISAKSLVRDCKELEAIWFGRLRRMGTPTSPGMREDKSAQLPLAQLGCLLPVMNVNDVENLVIILSIVRPMAIPVLIEIVMVETLREPRPLGLLGRYSIFVLLLIFLHLSQLHGVPANSKQFLKDISGVDTSGMLVKKTKDGYEILEPSAESYQTMIKQG